MKHKTQTERKTTTRRCFRGRESLTTEGQQGTIALGKSVNVDNPAHNSKSRTQRTTTQQNNTNHPERTTITQQTTRSLKSSLFTMNHVFVH